MFSTGVAITVLHFNPRPPRGGRPYASRMLANPTTISIHAPREGGDLFLFSEKKVLVNFNPRPPRGGRLRKTAHNIADMRFQSTPPARGATLCFCAGVPSLMISIHAPREGGDFLVLHRPWLPNDFNPRPPRGGRQPISYLFQGTGYFNPRPPRGGRRYVYAIFVVL